MDERVDIMTDNQFYSILKMVKLILKGCGSVEEAIKQIDGLLRDRDKDDSEKGKRNTED